MTLVATQVKRRRGTTAENDAFTGAEGEVTVDLTTHELRVHDGSTVGGHTIPTKNYGYSKAESDNLLSGKANVALDNLTSAGKEVCANMAMPSNRYVSLTLGTSGATYTAPADGYFYLRKTGTALNQYAFISGGGIAQDVFNPISGTGTRSVWFPVKKGTIVTISYNMGGSTNTFRFVYAEGVSE